jgi:hypothetical protein
MRRRTEYPAEPRASKTFNEVGPDEKHVGASFAFTSPGTEARETVLKDKEKKPCRTFALIRQGRTERGLKV